MAPPFGFVAALHRSLVSSSDFKFDLSYTFGFHVNFYPLLVMCNFLFANNSEEKKTLLEMSVFNFLFIFFSTTPSNSFIFYSHLFISNFKEVWKRKYLCVLLICFSSCCTWPYHLILPHWHKLSVQSMTSLSVFHFILHTGFFSLSLSSQIFFC